MSLGKITTCLWFDGKAEEAADYYTSIFKNSKITQVQRYTKDGQEVHGQPEGKVMVVRFSLDGHPFVGLNGGPLFKFNEAVSFQVDCADQDEVDYFWEKLGEGGDESKRRCGWLEDKFGVSWQVIPKKFIELVSGPDKDAVGRVTVAMMKMQKLDVAELERAYDGVE